MYRHIKDTMRQDVTPFFVFITYTIGVNDTFTSYHLRHKR